MCPTPMLRGTVLAALLLSGCAAARAESTPTLLVRPGLAERLALMEQYRHHDDLRPTTPTVTVEEIDDDEATETDAGDDAPP